MDIVVAPRDGGAWELRDLLGRAMGVIVKAEKGFLIAPEGQARNLMRQVARGPHATLDAALAEIETSARAACRRTV